ncbi:ribonuclease domain-containing protein [Apibacter sp. HY039]|uniref:ribonuclease domain-containing protein n=1 Tax=Apibacter sp. HY039 TaxID=2501476 RepID=UPI000FEBEE44|nr:ribonuclease domain-containing protein [Apibacter sp. HY039]
MLLKKQTLIYTILFGLLIITGIIFSYKNAKQHVNIQQFDVQELSSENVVVPYIRLHHSLPTYYITKKEARKSGWKPEQGNLCKILPGKIIGGDLFTNRENKLPFKKGRIWFEADINYQCNQRGAERVIFSSDGLIFITHDHYKTFEKK